MKTKYWIARDKNGELYLYDKEPSKKEFAFSPTNGKWFRLDDNSHPEITFENSPQQIEI